VEGKKKPWKARKGRGRQWEVGKERKKYREWKKRRKGSDRGVANGRGRKNRGRGRIVR
jgi:hypothetical protein